MLARGGASLDAVEASVSLSFTVGAVVFVLLAQWFVALKPETGTDGLAMHLAIPLDILNHHRMTFEPSRFLWAVMPMGADWAYSIAALLDSKTFVQRPGVSLSEAKRHAIDLVRELKAR